jgi:hypothetical protein
VHLWQKTREGFWCLIGPATHRVTRMQMQDGRAGFGGGHGFISNLLWRDGQMR